MACTRPVAVKKRGESLSTFATELVPCGNCLGCDLERSRQWAVRLMHESALHESSWFGTFTYDEEHLPPGGSLDPRAFPLFMKRLRKRVGKVRYFYCGEYGEQFSRPHYHACLFGLELPDLRQVAVRGGFPVWTSALLSAVWVDGIHELGSLTFDSAAYVARYVTKKVRGAAAESHYLAVDVETGELVSRTQEFAQMSRRPGLGAGWFERFGAELEPDGTVIQSGKEVPMPRYYRKLMKDGSPEAERRLARAGELRRLHEELVGHHEPGQFEKNEAFLRGRTNLSRGL